MTCIREEEEEEECESDDEQLNISTQR